MVVLISRVADTRQTINGTKRIPSLFHPLCTHRCRGRGRCACRADGGRSGYGRIATAPVEAPHRAVLLCTGLSPARRAISRGRHIVSVPL